MKWLLYAAGTLLAIVLVAVLVLLLLGGARGISRHVATVQIARPAPIVYTWITEPERLKEWVGWLVEVRTLTPPDGGTGARQIWVMEDRNNANQLMELETEVVRHEPPDLLETRVRAAELFSGTVRYELQPIDPARTLLSYRATFEYHSWLARLLEPLISRAAQQKLQEDLARLKERAEAE